MTTASVEVPLTKPPAASRTPASSSRSALTSVTVMIAFTSAAGSGAASTTTMAVIVPCVQRLTEARPAGRRSASPASKAGPEADQEVGAESREPAHLGVLLVEDVLRARDQLEALEPPELVEQPVRPAGVHSRVPAVVHVAVAVELAS